MKRIVIFLLAAICLLGLAGCGKSYSSDDECNPDNIIWMNKLAKGKDISEEMTQCIMFKSNYHSPKYGGGAWRVDEEYTDWQWWLARTEGGDWHILTSGYGG